MSETIWTSGYAKSELEAAQQQFKLEFPSDLVALLLDRRPVGSLDWRTDQAKIEDALSWPLKGILFDIDHSDFWLSDWGEKPQKKSDQHAIARDAIEAAPKLIPVYSHRYIPQEPNEEGNPVFSVYQTDVIYYGSNLEHYFENEFGAWSAKPFKEYKVIPFWSDLVLLNSGPYLQS
ncbi:MAG: SMI1/KNR4 family protein [Pseudomonadota bacterium]